MIVVAETSPVNYLALIHEADLLSRLFGQVLIPPAVWEELNDPDTPAPVRTWIAQAPYWLQVQPLHSPPRLELDYLDDGEREAITLAEELHADEILAALSRLQETTFYASSDLIRSLLDEDAHRRKGPSC